MKTQSVSLLIKSILLSIIIMLSSHNASANNLTVSNVSLTGLNTGSQYVMVKCNISWDNSWRTSSAPNNWDAAWVFVKFKVNGDYTSTVTANSPGTTITVASTANLRKGMPVKVTSGTGTFVSGTVVTSITNGTTFEVSASPSIALSSGAVVTGYAIWEHATLSSTSLEHSAPAGSTITPAADGTGIFIYRNAEGLPGTNTFNNAELRWNYGVNGVPDGAPVDINVYAIEMVYVPQGPFYIGDGGNMRGVFYKYPTPTNPYQITNEGAITVGTSTDNLYYPNAGYYSGDQTGTIPNEFPKGYNSFYCMKYEIEQIQYVNFLNSLTRNQQSTMSASLITEGITSVTNRYLVSGTPILSNRNGIRCDGTIDGTLPVTIYCDLNGNGIGNESNDGLHIACNFLSWNNVAAYLDWSGLRPMSELEFEKSCRGTINPVANEFAWGTTGQLNIYPNEYTLSNSGTNNENIANNYSTTLGNSAYYGTILGQGESGINGPLRVGIFSGNINNTGRVTSGSTYYGIMEMSGNVWERIVSVGNASGRAFSGSHGNGILNFTGNADVLNWPGTNSVGSGFRGGFWGDGGNDGSYERVSGRFHAAYSDPNGTGITNHFGGRGVRTAP